VYLTVIDYCGPPPAGSDAHFDIAPDAFRQLFGDAGVTAGIQYADWQFVTSNNCLGNKGNSGGSPPPSNPPPSNPPPSNPPPSNPPPASGSSTTRCGNDWSDASSRCGTPCTYDDGPCGGGHCYADLPPCSSFAQADDSSFSADNFVIEESFNNDNFDNFAVDAAVADVAEAEYVDNYVDMAMADANFGADLYLDAAVAGDISSLNTPQTQQGEAMQGWMVAILVIFSITTVLLLAVIVLGIFVMRKH